MAITPIETTSELEKVCKRLMSSEYITVDTEFLRKTTYYAQLCLIQIANETEAHIIDPLAKGIDLKPFYDLMAKGPIKVLHAARQDLEIFLHADGRLPHPVFDTQVAAMVCGYGESVGYETLVKSIANKTLDKSARFTDWSRRPLSEKQLSYALSDVTHLRAIYKKLAQQLEETGRMKWLQEEEAVITNPGTYRIEPEDAWLRLKCKSSNRRFLALVRELCAWRETEAQSSDVPRNRIVRDEIILELAAHPPKSADDIQKVRGVPKRLSGKSGAKAVLDMVTAVNKMPDDQLPEPTNSKQHHFEKAGPSLDLLKVLLKMKCAETGVASKLIASASELEDMARGDLKGLKFLSGWRYELFGKHAERLMSGKLALSVVGKNIVVRDSAD